MKNILISGAGIAGLSIARQFKKHGIAYTLIEKKTTLDTAGISIALPANAVRALRYMGFSDEVAKMHQVNRIMIFIASSIPGWYVMVMASFSASYSVIVKSRVSPS